MVNGWPHMSNPADETFFFILAISVFLLAVNTVVMIYFVIRYNRKRHPEARDVHENLPLEITWTVVPTILVLAIFFVGWKGFLYMRTVPPDAMPVKVTARQWSWHFQYENGKQDNVLRVPVKKPVKLLITSADVLHSLFIPAYRIKEDCVPGMETYLWFLPDEPGSYDLFCTEYCGLAHADMVTRVVVMPEQEFNAWYQEGGDTADAAEERSETTPSGASLLNVKGCLACHSTDGTQKIGPTFKGLFGKKEVVIRNSGEAEVTVDEAFLKRKMLDPEQERIKGFPPIMPSQRGLLSDEEIEEIIEHLKKL